MCIIRTNTYRGPLGLLALRLFSASRMASSMTSMYASGVRVTSFSLAVLTANSTMAMTSGWDASTSMEVRSVDFSASVPELSETSLA